MRSSEISGLYGSRVTDSSYRSKRGRFGSFRQSILLSIVTVERFFFTVSPLPVSLWPKSPQKFHAQFLISTIILSTLINLIKFYSKLNKAKCWCEVSWNITACSLTLVLNVQCYVPSTIYVKCRSRSS